MKHYVVTGRVFEVPANARVELTQEQYTIRRHAVKLIKDNVYDTLNKIEFKQGEKVVTDLEIGKAQMVEVIPVKEGSDPAMAVEAAKKADEISKGAKGKK